MNTGLGSRVADNADRLARALAGAGVGLGALASNRQATEVADTTVAFDGLEALEVHADFAAQVALDDVLAVLDGMNNLRELSLGQIFGADAGIDIGFGQDDLGIGGANAVDVAQGNVDALIGWNFNSDDTSHRGLD